jgi:peptidyl-prolyl cis-trans isomerase C
MRFTRPSAKLAATLLVALLGAAGLARADDPAIATVNGVAIPQSRMDFILKMQAAQGQKDSAEVRSQLKEALITREIVAQEALRKGLDQTVDVRTQTELAKQQALVSAYIEDWVTSHQPSDEAIKAEYERVKSEQFDPAAREFKARHILVKKEADAKAIIAALAKGKKFDELAKAKSEDIGSKTKGGELDWTDGSNLVKPFADAMRALKKGETTKAPVQTQYGWHVIRLDDDRIAAFPAYEEVKENLMRTMVAKSRDDLIAELRKNAKVE